MLRNWLGDWVGTFLGEADGDLLLKRFAIRSLHGPLCRSQGCRVVEQDFS